jgi:D-lactate dehydrogenase
MKMIAYAVEPEERPVFTKIAAELAVDLTMTAEKPSLDNAHLTEGMDVLNVLSDTVLTPEMWDVYAKNGIRLAVTRTIGMEHMNLNYAASLGIPVRNITYSPSSVADYAIMMMLMVLRNIKPTLLRYAGQDFTVGGLRGRELPNMTVGIVGAGRIGQTVARHLTGFGCRILYWNRTPTTALDGVAEPCDLETLLASSDIVSLHLAATEETHHFLNAQRMAQMKDGAILINTARGPLVDSAALIDALEQGKLAGAGLDVFDGDRDIYYRDHKNRIVPSRARAILGAMPNVLLLPHMAYFTDQALEDMVCNSVRTARELFPTL